MQKQIYTSFKLQSISTSSLTFSSHALSLFLSLTENNCCSYSTAFLLAVSPPSVNVHPFKSHFILSLLPCPASICPLKISALSLSVSLSPSTHHSLPSSSLLSPSLPISSLRSPQTNFIPSRRLFSHGVRSVNHTQTHTQTHSLDWTGLDWAVRASYSLRSAGIMTGLRCY